MAPPLYCSFQLRGCARGDFNRDHLAQELRRRRRRSSSADMVSPRSTCAIDSSNSASNAGGTTKVRSVSRARIMTTVPSENGSPSTMILPPTTVPVVSCMSAILHRSRCKGSYRERSENLRRQRRRLAGCCPAGSRAEKHREVSAGDDVPWEALARISPEHSDNRCPPWRTNQRTPPSLSGRVCEFQRGLRGGSLTAREGTCPADLL